LLYIVTALKSEAQAFVDYFKLKKNKLQNFVLYENQEIKLIVSNIGVDNARAATQTLLNFYDITPEDIFINVGVCAADHPYAIGELITLGGVVYKEKHYVFDKTKPSIVCCDAPCSEALYPLADMESFGFYDAVLHNPAIKNFYILKVVSDHFEPESLSKDGVKSLLFQQIKTIMEILKD